RNPSRVRASSLAGGRRRGGSASGAGVGRRVRTETENASESPVPARRRRNSHCTPCGSPKSQRGRATEQNRPRRGCCGERAMSAEGSTTGGALWSPCGGGGGRVGGRGGAGCWGGQGGVVGWF